VQLAIAGQMQDAASHAVEATEKELFSESVQHVVAASRSVRSTPDGASGDGLDTIGTPSPQLQACQ